MFPRKKHENCQEKNCKRHFLCRSARSKILQENTSRRTALQPSLPKPLERSQSESLYSHNLKLKHAKTLVANLLQCYFLLCSRIIPIYLVHRPSNDIPYATLEEELIGDFVKYSVKDGKEINLMRRDSEAGQKCCAFQHWVYHKTEGNLLVTDMQG